MQPAVSRTSNHHGDTLLHRGSTYSRFRFSCTDENKPRGSETSRLNDKSLWRNVRRWWARTVWDCHVHLTYRYSSTDMDENRKASSSVSMLPLRLSTDSCVSASNTPNGRVDSKLLCSCLQMRTMNNWHPHPIRAALLALVRRTGFATM